MEESFFPWCNFHETLSHRALTGDLMKKIIIYQLVEFVNSFQIKLECVSARIHLETKWINPYHLIAISRKLILTTFMEWLPANTDHAIERVSFSLLFREPLPQKPLSLIQEKLGQKATLAGITERLMIPKMLQFRLDAQGTPVQQQLLGSASQTYRRVENGRVLEEITCNESSIVFAVSAYSSWTKFMELAQACLSELIEHIVQITNIGELRVEYWDRFDLKASSDGFSTEGLVNPNSKLLPSFFANRQQPLHAHVGFFTPVINGERVLINANMDVFANTPELPPTLAPHLVAQAGFHTLAHTQFVNSDSGFEDWRHIRATAYNNHDSLKAVLCDMIHSSLAARISLDAAELPS